MVSMSDCYVGGLLIESVILLLLKHAYGEVTGCHAGHQEVGRCCTRGESEVYYVGFCQVQIRLPTLALKPRGDIIRSPKQGYQWPHKKDLCPPKIFQKKGICIRSGNLSVE